MSKMGWEEEKLYLVCPAVVVEVEVLMRGMIIKYEEAAGSRSRGLAINSKVFL